MWWKTMRPTILSNMWFWNRHSLRSHLTIEMPSHLPRLSMESEKSMPTTWRTWGRIERAMAPVPVPTSRTRSLRENLATSMILSM